MQNLTMQFIVKEKNAITVSFELTFEQATDNVKLMSIIDNYKG